MFEKVIKVLYHTLCKETFSEKDAILYKKKFTILKLITQISVSFFRNR